MSRRKLVALSVWSALLPFREHLPQARLGPLGWLLLSAQHFVALRA